MSEPILEIERLTVRFGGLTAVCEVDLRIEPDQIFAVIGPNGAGKTTVFNAISGIYEPTAGRVRFCGRELRRPMTRRNLLRWAVSGLLVGCLVLLFASNVNLLWAAVVKENFRDGRFETAAAVKGLRAYMRGEPRVEQRMGAFFVSSHDGKETLATVLTRAAADSALSVARHAQADRASRTRAARWIAFIVGTITGAAAGYATWRQTRRTPPWIAAQGMARTFQNIRLFQDMTVLENVLVALDRRAAPKAGSRAWILGPALLVLLVVALAATARHGASLASAQVVFPMLGLGSLGYLAYVARQGAFSRHAVRREAEAKQEAREVLDFVGIADKAEELSKNLAYGDKRRLEIARALATRPKLLLLDEPAAGMNPTETLGLMGLIRNIRDRGVAVLLIEHHMRVVMGISDRIAVLEYGRKIAEGTPAEICRDSKVIEAYLGKDEEAS